jgi:peptidoglycan hydrolase-like protein with peptidoglycan-binding domain
MNKKILNEIQQAKYLFDYKRGVVISEQKHLLNEGKIEDIVKGLKNASATWAGTHEQDFANSLRKILTWDEYTKVNELLANYLGLAGLIFDEFDTKDKDDQYWLKEFDKHFASIGLSTSFISGNRNVRPPNQEVATPQNSPENRPDPGEPSGSAPEKPKENMPDKEGWNEIVKHYNATPESYELEDVKKILIYKRIKISDNGKEYFLENNGSILSILNRSIGEWSWENNKPVLNINYKVTKPASGFVSGDEEVSCHEEFCTNKKVAGRGATGYCVKEIQSYLLYSGLVDGIQLTKDLDACKSDFTNCDGVYGIETEKAVRKFQQENNITVDGIVGCETWGYL